MEIEISKGCVDPNGSGVLRQIISENPSNALYSLRIFMLDHFTDSIPMDVLSNIDLQASFSGGMRIQVEGKPGVYFLVLDMDWNRKDF
jgi:hypothetical protein